MNINEKIENIINENKVIGIVVKIGGIDYHLVG